MKKNNTPFSLGYRFLATNKHRYALQGFLSFLLLALCNPLSMEAQAPNISYSGVAATYPLNIAIAALTPTNSGGAIDGKYGAVTTFAGNGSAGSTDGTGTAASFFQPYGIALDASGNVYVADYTNNKIRKITPLGVVTTFAGSGAKGSTDGTGTAASFSGTTKVAVDASGNVYVTEGLKNKIRKITPLGVVTTFAGSGAKGSTDGTGTAASFQNPGGIAFDASGNVYVADTYNHKIRKITPSGEVTTFAGTGTAGSTDGTGSAASFNQPQDIAFDASGNVYVADTYNYKIRKITPSGEVTTLAGSGAKGSANGTGTAASFNELFGIDVDALGNVYVADGFNNKIRKITPLGVVTTLAGSGAQGSADGTGTAASFWVPRCVALDALGNLYVADSPNNKIRKISLKGGGYSINPDLPRGLNFNNETGVISGTPYTVSITNTYTITGSNASGSSTTRITFSVDTPPTPPLTPEQPCWGITASHDLKTPLSFLSNMVISGNYLYLASGEGFKEFQIIDVTDPLTPILKGKLSSLRPPSSIAVYGNYAYIGFSSNSLGVPFLHIVDVSDPNNPKKIGELKNTDPQIKLVAPGKILKNNNHLYFAETSSNTIFAVDISDPQKPSRVLLNSTVSGSPLAIQDSTFFLLRDGLAFTVTMTTPSTLIKPRVPFITKAKDVIILGWYVYALTNDNKFVITHNEYCTTCGERAYSKGIDIMPNVRSFTISGNYAYIVGDYMLQIINIFDPLKPELEVSMKFNKSPHGLAISGNNVYLTSIYSDILNVINRFNCNIEGLKRDTASFVLGLPLMTTADKKEAYAVWAERRIGILGIGRQARTNALEVDGAASKSSAGDWLANSDLRLKKQIKNLDAEQTLQNLLSLKGITYEWADDKTGTKRPQGIQYGFTAQNIKQVFPNLVEEDSQGYLQTAYGTYDAMTVEAIRALYNRIEKLEKENLSLKTSHQSLQTQVNKINELETILKQLTAQQPLNVKAISEK